MEVGAYDRIDAWKLPRPRIVDVRDLGSLPPEAIVYLRGPKFIAFLNRRCLVSEVIEPSFIEKLLEVEGLSIEVSPDSTFGGTALLFESELYVESVQGHVSSLLHGGQCSMRTRRALVSGETLHRESHQEYMVVQSVSGSAASSNVPPASSLFFEAIETVADILSSLRREEGRLEPILFEWMWTSDGRPVFIDCKDRDIAPWYSRLDDIVKGEVGIVESTVSSASVEVCMIRDYCSSFGICWPPFHARVRSQALLSHFFTYTASVPRVIEMV